MIHTEIPGSDPVHTPVLSLQEADAAVPLVAPGLAKYLRIMEIAANAPAFHDDPEFRRRFNGFYRVRRSAAEWQPHFFELMGRAKVRGMGFAEILSDFLRSTGMVESSFASKLYATLAPTAPVIDSVSVRSLGQEG